MKDQKKHKKRCGNCDHFIENETNGIGTCGQFEIKTHKIKYCKNHSGFSRGKK